MSRPSRPRKVLFVSYYAAPWGGPQGFRTSQILRHLPAGGWEPTLLTVRPEAYGSGAAARDDSFPEARRNAIETRTLPLDRLIERFRAAGAAGDPAPEPGMRRRHSLMTRLVAYLTTPDRLVTWVPFGIAGGLREARRCDLIYASGPPFTNHLVGLALSRLTRKPLIVSVDDPWVSMEHRTWYSDGQRAVHARLERAILKRADAVLTPTTGFGQDLIDRLGPDLGGPVRALHWGYDPEEIPDATRPPIPPPIRLAYAGSLRGAQYDPSGLFEALQRMAAADPNLAQRLQLDFYGEPEERYRELGGRGALAGLVNFHGYRPHREVVEACAGAHAGILIINDTFREFPWYLSAKIYLYAGLRRPVLGLVPPEGDAARLLADRRLGISVAPHDIEGIIAAIERIEVDHLALEDAIGDTSDLTAAVAVQRLVALLDDVLSGRSGQFQRSKATFS